MFEVINEKRRNASSRIPIIAKAAITRTGFELVEHPLYSLDLPPNDYSLFSKIKERLHGKIFSTNNGDVL